MLTDYLYCYCIPRWDLDRQLQQTSRYLPGYRLSILAHSLLVCTGITQSNSLDTQATLSPLPENVDQTCFSSIALVTSCCHTPHHAIPTRNCVVHVQVVVLLVGTPLSTRQLYRRFATPPPLTSFFSATMYQKGSVDAAFITIQGELGTALLPLLLLQPHSPTSNILSSTSHKR